MSLLIHIDPFNLTWQFPKNGHVISFAFDHPIAAVLGRIGLCDVSAVPWAFGTAKKPCGPEHGVGRKDPGSQNPRCHLAT